MSQSEASRGSVALVAAATAFLVTLVLRLLFVRHYSVDMPFLDQWDAELGRLLLPQVRGELTWQSLFAPHNEHRIFFTRVLTLLVYAVEGVWSTRTVAQVQTILPATTASLLAYWSVRDCGARVSSWVLVVAVFGLPIAVTNYLWSFQNQFGFLLLFSIVAIRLAATEPSIPRFLAVIGFSVFAFLSMAGGAITPFVCAGMLGARALLSGRSARLVSMTIILVGVAALLYALTPNVPQHDALRAGSISTSAAAISLLLLFPAGAGAFVWLPLGYFVWQVSRREPRRILSFVFPLALCAWTLLLIVVLVARRGDLALLVYAQQKIFDRYLDLLLPAFAALCFLGNRTELDAKSEASERVQVPMGVLQIALALALVGFVQVQSFDRAALWQNRMRSQLSMTRAALATQGGGDPSLTFFTNPEETLALLKEARAAGILPASLGN